MNSRGILLAGAAVAACLIGQPIGGDISGATAQVGVSVSVTLDTLRERVAPQGDYVKVATIGEAWRPRGVPAGWKPYTRGNWIYNDKVGWYFNSDEPFAEVTYHYGRWYEDPDQGWVWVADTKWAPAWVEWRRNKQYVGWRPLPPENAPRRAARRNTTTVVVTESRGGGDYIEEEWIFVPANRIVDRVDIVMIQRDQVVEVYRQTQVVGTVQERGGIYVNLALQPAVLQRESNVTIQSRNLPQAQAVPVPAQVQQISTESKASVSAPAASAPAPAAAQSPAATTTPSSTSKPLGTTATPAAPANQTPAAATPPPESKSPNTAASPAAPANQTPTGAAPTSPPGAKTSGPLPAPSAAPPSKPIGSPNTNAAPTAAGPKPPVPSATTVAPAAPSGASTAAPPPGVAPPSSRAAPESGKAPAAAPKRPFRKGLSG